MGSEMRATMAVPASRLKLACGERESGGGRGGGGGRGRDRDRQASRKAGR